MKLTRKQREILKIVLEGNVSEKNGRFCDADIDEILERLPYKTTKQSLQFSLRSLVAKKMVEKGECECRRGRSRRTFSPTEMTKKIFSVED